jgi:DNA-binding XRE family transcriptional regulator
MTSRRHLLIQRRRMLGLSQEHLAGQLGVDRSTVVRWERGETAPQPWHRPKIARLLTLTVEELDDLLTDSTAGRDQPSERLDHALANPATADLISVACLREQVTSLASAYDSAPSAALLADAGQCLGQVAFLREHVTNAKVQRELTIAESEAATLMSQLVWDASGRHDQQTSLAFLDRAITAARQLGDKAGQSHALLRKSYIALYGSCDPSMGQQLAAAAAATARHVSNALTGLAHLHAAEASAMMGDRRACEHALSTAENYLDRVSQHEQAAGLFSPAQYGRLAGSCYLYLSDAGRARRILQATVGQLGDRQKSRAIVLGNLSLACIRQRELDQAASYLSQAINVIEQTRAAGGLAVAFTAGRELRPWQSEPVVQDVCDRLLTLIAAPSAGSR